MTEKLQKILSTHGVASRRHAEQMIEQGRVSCNGRVCHLGDRADPELDTILVDGKPLPSVGEKVYLMLHKPRGFVTTLSDDLAVVFCEPLIVIELSGEDVHLSVEIHLGGKPIFKIFR